jgi:hypothetical protein
MTTRKYSSRSQQTTLASGITDTATSCTVVSGSALLGGATVPAGTTFTVVIDPDTALEEIVDVTVVSTNVLTITRGVENNGTGQAHSPGAAVRHMAIGRDFREANLHIEATGGYNDGTGAHTMHGIASGEGDVVGTLKAQTLTQKTLTSPIITNPSISGAGVDASIIFEGAVADAHETTLTVQEPTQDNVITLPNATGTVVLAAVAQTLTNKTMGDALNAGGFKITNLATPTLASDAVRKDFADAQVAAAATSAASAATSAASAATSASSALTSANSSATSAANALTSANSAATSASTMAASVTAAASSATAAATSATSAAASATAAATSATSASASATAASTSATSAAASATAAATSATSAAASATTAANSVATIAGYATTASNSASAAATSASSALTSQTAAATSATSAAASATAAATSATSAAASATAAATSATSAAASATAAAGYVVPSQTGNAGKFLGTNGTAVSWNGAVSTDGGSTITVASGTTVPLTIQNNGTGNSFVVNDVASDTTPFVVDQSGNVAVGNTLSVGSTATVGGSTVNTGTALIANAQAFLNSNVNWNYGNLEIRRNASNTSTPRFIDMILDGDSAESTTIGATNSIWGIYDSSPTTGSLSSTLNSVMGYGAYAGHRWYTNGTERMRIASTGLVGIGTTPSGAMLSILNTTTGNIGLLVKGASGQTAELLQIQSNAGTVLFEVDSAGNVGIGTSSLTVAGGYGSITLDGTNGSLWSAKVAGTETFRIQPTSIATEINGIANLPLLFKTNNTERMRIDNAGNVGIGGIAPSAALEVATSSSGVGGMLVTNTNSNGYTQIYAGANAGLLRNGSSNAGYAGVSSLSLFTLGANPVGIVTNNNLRMIVNADGNVGIGTATPTAKLDVNGDARFSNQYYAGKNGLINSAFDISQRGATITGINSDHTYTADRWSITRGGSIDYAQKTVAGGNNPPAGFDAYGQYKNQSAANPFLTLGQTLETKDAIRFAGKTVTVSFYARATANTTKSKEINAYVGWNTTADTRINTFSAGAYFPTLFGTAATDWTYCTFSAAVPSTAKTVGVYFLQSPSGGLAVNDGFEITGVQLELGSVATTFSRNSGTIQGELAACQRYYQRFTAVNQFDVIATAGNCWSTTKCQVIVPNTVTMRTAPTVFENSNLALNSNADTRYTTGVFTNASGSPSHLMTIYTHGSAVFTGGYTGFIQANANGAYIAFGAEL